MKTSILITLPLLLASTGSAAPKTVNSKAKMPARTSVKTSSKVKTTKPQNANLIEAKFDLPAFTRLGTPKVIRDTTAPVWKKRQPVYLPKGARVVSRGKTVTSSDDFPIIGTLSMITDGAKAGSEGNWVELGPGPQWVQIDLGKATTMYGVLLWHYFGESRVYRDVIVQASNDADFVTGVTTLYNNDGDNSSGLGIGQQREFYEDLSGQWIAFNKPQKARYLRLYSRGNTSDPQNQYIEAEVWGDPNK
jgi:hypothetical protein